MITLFAAISSLLHILFFLLESVFFKNEKVYRRFGFKSNEASITKIVFFNQGFYNLFLAAGAVIGIYYYNVFHEPLLLLYVSASMTGAGIILFLSKPKLFRTALIQGVFPLITIILIIIQ